MRRGARDWFRGRTRPICGLVFYALETGAPVFGERDRTVHSTVTELSLERRKGYGWDNARPVSLRARYAAWQKESGVTP